MPKAHTFGTVECSLWIEDGRGKHSIFACPGFFYVLEVPEAHGSAPRGQAIDKGLPFFA